MTDQPNNPPAFPTMEHGTSKVGTPEILTYEGMTLLDYFAAKAMHGVMTGNGYRDSLTPESISEAAYKIAQAMLAERSKHVK